MNDCLFCQIVKGDVLSHKVWEDEEYLAVLDIFPLRRGQTIVMPKKHQESYVFKLDDRDLSSLFLATKKVALRLDGALGAARSLLVMEGLGVNHAHVKLYPLIDPEKEGALLHLGPRADENELNDLKTKIQEGGMK